MLSKWRTQGWHLVQPQRWALQQAAMSFADLAVYVKPHDCFPLLYSLLVELAASCRALLARHQLLASLPHLPLVAPVGDPEVHPGIAVIHPVRLQHLRQL